MQTLIWLDKLDFLPVLSWENPSLEQPRHKGFFLIKMGGALGTRLSLEATYCFLVNNIYGLKLE